MDELKKAYYEARQKVSEDAEVHPGRYMAIGYTVIVAGSLAFTWLFGSRLIEHGVRRALK